MEVIKRERVRMIIISYAETNLCNVLELIVSLLHYWTWIAKKKFNETANTCFLTDKSFSSMKKTHHLHFL